MHHLTTLRRPSRAVALVAAAATMLGLGLVAPASGATTPHWALATIPASKDFPLQSVACTSTGGCVAMAQACSPQGCGGPLAGKAFSSKNAGASWTAGGFPSGYSNPGNIACGTSTFCVVGAEHFGSGVTYAVLVTHNAGASFAVHAEPNYSTSGAACASANDCLVLAQGHGSLYTTATLRTVNGGTTWTAAIFPGTKDYVNHAACGSATDCVAIGSSSASKPVAFLSTNDGASWKAVALPPAFTGGLSALSCTGVNCIALTATQALFSKNGGKSWSLKAVPSSSTWRGASCMGTTCVLVGGSTSSNEVPVATITKNAGSTWIAQSLPHVRGLLFAIDCTTTSCAAVGTKLIFVGATASSEVPLAYTY